MTVGENIKRIRLQRGLTQAELGYLVGIAESAIRRYELELSKPKIDKLERIAHALGVNVEVLLNSDFSNITAMHRLFQLFRQYEGSFSSDGSIKFRTLDLSPWYKRWLEYQDELAKIQHIDDDKKRTYALEDAEDKLNWWMDTYPKSDSYNVNFDDSLENYRLLKNKRRKKGNT